VNVQVVVRAGSERITEEVYAIGDLGPKQGETVEGSGQIGIKKALKALKGSSIWAEGFYEKDGEEHHVKGGCWYKR
jgi:hypothetical protein